MVASWASSWQRRRPPCAFKAATFRPPGLSRPPRWRPIAAVKTVRRNCTWADAPKGTESFALIVHDPDAPIPGGFFHWVVYNLPIDDPSVSPPTQSSLPTSSARRRAAKRDTTDRVRRRARRTTTRSRFSRSISRTSRPARRMTADQLEARSRRDTSLATAVAKRHSIASLGPHRPNVEAERSNG